MLRIYDFLELDEHGGENGAWQALSVILISNMHLIGYC
jgi:hypothetical protein